MQIPVGSRSGKTVILDSRLSIHNINSISAPIQPRRVIEGGSYGLAGARANCWGWLQVGDDNRAVGSHDAVGREVLTLTRLGL
ncbi:hypothetical protein C5Y97_12200 [Blastopirellula marina]|uniref:Uncharacterized protein n=1 Tax=Blastopirellula marina TaxID=124 RepID=A0A2S8FWA1_9BACT|nr:hypothetical protein C5Y98_12190 [Blastopirellula marina]PTL44292.1 hypothetical protein C5Y97_12200 [Blastopirellula marina]